MLRNVMFFLLGILTGLWVAYLAIAMSPIYGWGTDKRECEETVPRNQNCVMVWVPETKKE